MMGKRGPKPTPTRLRLIIGQTGGGRPIPKNEPQLPDLPHVPSAPAWLNKYAREKWDELAGVLQATGLLTGVDLDIFAVFCACAGQLRTAEEDFARIANVDASSHGIVARSASGSLILNPLFRAIVVLRRDLARLGAELGLSPSARSSIDTDKAGGVDAIASKYGL
jgi:P27 family predicted phage terminase small subunit